jgi:hypothetical protein
MASAYFLNGQTQAISIGVNSPVATHPLAGLMDQNNDPFVSVGLAANAGKDVVGTDATNEIVVTTTGQADSISWNVTMSQITPDQDIQFLVFENQLLARQGSTSAGFTIQQQT